MAITINFFLSFYYPNNKQEINMNYQFQEILSILNSSWLQNCLICFHISGHTFLDRDFSFLNFVLLLVFYNTGYFIFAIKVFLFFFNYLCFFGIFKFSYYSIQLINICFLGESWEQASNHQDLDYHFL